MARDTITIDGLTQFNRSLKKLDSDLPKALRIALNEAVEIVIKTARPRIPRRSGRAARSLKAKSTRTAARISFGGRLAPYAPWLDFGGKVGRSRSVNRPFYTDGRYVWRAFGEKRKDVQAELEKSLVNLAQGAGLEVS